MTLKSVLTSAVFTLVILGFAAGHLLLSDKDVSVSERRPLTQRPNFTVSALLSGSFTDKLEEYLLDQFPLRDQLRQLKALWHFDVYRQSDNNGIYLAGDQVCKLDSTLKPEEVTALIDNTNNIVSTYLSGMDVTFTLIPDKNYFAAEENGYPALDYTAMDSLLESGLDESIRYVGMTPFADLTLDDYYRTDIHWRQERLQSVLNDLGTAMGFAPADLTKYTQTAYSPFYGSYYGQSALNVDPDTLITLSNDVIDGAVLSAPELGPDRGIYDPADFSDMDGYNVYMGGPLGLVTITNPAGTTGKELVIFRDSFAGSLAPLLLESYDTITLIDLRYMAGYNVGQFVEFNTQDVLFLYSTTLVNSGKLLK